MSSAPSQPASANANDSRGYGYDHATLNHSHGYLLPTMEKLLAKIPWKSGAPKRIFELGCGNGSVAAWMTSLGYDVTGVDPSDEGIRQANAAFPNLKLHEGSAYDDLAAKYGQFPVLTSLEVVEHVYFPRKYAACAYALVEPGGTALISTPYHGYLKNVALAVSGKMDSHFTALWDYGHIKFWSRKTLGKLLIEAGFKSVEFVRVGRLAVFAKSMIAIAHK